MMKCHDSIWCGKCNNYRKKEVADSFIKEGDTKETKTINGEEITKIGTQTEKCTRCGTTETNIIIHPNVNVPDFLWDAL